MSEWGLSRTESEQALVYYREHFASKGLFENVPYEGIGECLSGLKTAGMRLFVATSKPEHTAIEIMDKFQLSQYFEEICGGTPDGSRDEKSKVIAYLLSKIDRTDNVYMIGDTAFDALGAAVHGIPTIGVSWGYGSTESMNNAGVIAIVHNADELYQMIINL